MLQCEMYRREPEGKFTGNIICELAIVDIKAGGHKN